MQIMPGFRKVRKEALAQRLADGLNVSEAMAAAGYCGRENRERTRRRAEDVAPRVLEIRRGRTAAATDLAPLIASLEQIASHALAQGVEAAILREARQALAEAAKLKIALRNEVEKAEMAEAKRIPLGVNVTLPPDEWNRMAGARYAEPADRF
ncbi:MAG TPA: hypothetical protein VG248_10700 [Caulobacteraceae bacterium]|jgi:hypothetical protein|nr:hypothetical protein [Caulobacteraceae bacterium]